jgi:hypothetical protein
VSVTALREVPLVGCEISTLYFWFVSFAELGEWRLSGSVKSKPNVAKVVDS